jgi:hypothetical protein
VLSALQTHNCIGKRWFFIMFRYVYILLATQECNFDLSLGEVRQWVVYDRNWCSPFKNTLGWDAVMSRLGELIPSHEINFSAVLSGYLRTSPIPRRLWLCRNITKFLWQAVVSVSPNPQAGESPLFGCPRLLIQYIRSYPPYLEAIPCLVKA